MSEPAKPLRFPSASGSDRRAGLSRGDLQLCAAALLAGSGWLFSINALAALPPLFFMGSRFILAGVLIGFFADIASLRRARGDWLPLAISAGAMALSMIGWILALKHTSHAGVAAFITATGNLMVPLVGTVFFAGRSREACRFRCRSPARGWRCFSSTRARASTGRISSFSGPRCSGPSASP